MADDLVQRLRSNRPIPTLPHEAADRIEEMDRHLTMSGKVNKALSERIEVLEAENKWLRERAEHYSDQWTAVGTKGQAIIDQLCAENKQAHDALSDLLHAVCGEKGFAEAVRRDSGRIYPWPALELAEAKARAALDQSK